MLFISQISKVEFNLMYFLLIFNIYCVNLFFFFQKIKGQKIFFFFILPKEHTINKQINSPKTFDLS